MIDNYDSFTYNLVHLFEELGAEVVTVRNDAITPDEAVALAPDRLVVSPGPGRPRDAGMSIELIRRSARRRRRSASASATRRSSRRSAARSARRKALLHGKSSVVTHDGDGVFRGLPDEVEVGRYHSLAATTVPDELAVTSRTEDGEVMGVRHADLSDRRRPVPPESVLTPLGPTMARNFLT